MARPIEETPFLSGKDAERFIKIIENPKKVSMEVRENTMRNYEKMKSIATFNE